jgi:hypothetical protein
MIGSDPESGPPWPGPGRGGLGVRHAGARTGRYLCWGLPRFVRSGQAYSGYSADSYTVRTCQPQPTHSPKHMNLGMNLGHAMERDRHSVKRQVGTANCVGPASLAAERTRESMHKLQSCAP